MRPAWPDRRTAPRARAASLAAAARLAEPGEDGGCVLCNTCNSFPCKIHAKSDADVCCVRAGARRSERDALDQRAARARLITDPAGSKVEAVEIERDGEIVRVDGAAGHRLVRRRELGGAAAAVGARDTSSTAWRIRPGWSARRYMAHLATMMQGFHPFRKNDDGVSEDRGDQRLLPARAGRAYPLGQIQSQGRTHGVMAQTGGAAWIPLWAYDAWVSRGVDWLAMSEDLPERREPRDASSPTAASGSQYRPNNMAAHSAARQGDEADSAPARVLVVVTHSHRRPRTRLISAARWCSAPIRAPRCSIPSAARTMSRTCSSSTRRSFRRRRRSIRR